MSHFVEVFVASDLPLDDFAYELGALLGMELEAFTDGNERSYGGTAPGIVCAVWEHVWTDEEDVPFNKYRYILRLRGTINYAPDRERRLYEYAHFVFDKLKDQGKYPILLTDEMETKLDEFTPA